MRMAAGYFVLFVMMGFVSLAMAQSVPTLGVSVLAVVDGEPISSIDFEERRNFLIKTTGIEYNDQTREQIDNDVLQMLIDDIIKVNEGKRFGVGFEDEAKVKAKELTDASFSPNGEDPDAVMRSLGIDRAIAEEKFLADVLWVSTVQARFSKQFANISTEAQDELERIKSNVQKTHMNIDEIILLPEPNRDFTSTKKLAEQIYDALTKGADFGRIAQQYSAAGSSRNGGKLGWILAERLHENIRNTLLGAPLGAFIRPAEIDGALHIYRINGKRLEGQTDPREAQVQIARLIYPLDVSNAGAVLAGRNRLAADLEGVRSCGDLTRLHQSYGTSLPSELGQFRILNFTPALQQLIVGLNTGEMTDIVNFPEGLGVFMVCDRIEATLALPSLDAIEEKIYNSHFSALSSRLLTRLRKQATISYRERP